MPVTIAPDPVAAGLRSVQEPLFDRFLVRAEMAAEEPGGMGDLEDDFAEELREMQRVALERASQKKADGADHSRCPACAGRLERVSSGHERHVRTRFGEVSLRRSKGFCPRCEQWRFPADDLLGLDKRATASPGVQRAESLLVSKMPAQEAAKVMREISGLPADDSTMSREARRQGERAKQLRDRMDEEACHTEGRWRVTRKLREQLGPAPFVLVIEMDAWLVRASATAGARRKPCARPARTSRAGIGSIRRRSSVWTSACRLSRGAR